MALEKSDERKTPFFYGWVIAAASAVIYALTNAGTFCFGIFIKPMSQEFGWARADVVLAVAFFIIVGVALFVITGRICDRHGPKPLTLVGGISMAFGYFLCSRVTELWHFYIGFSVFGGIGLACIYVPLTATISRWFIKRRGTALGIVYAGGGFGGLLLSPILQSVIDSSGWQTAWIVLLVLTAVFTVPVTILVKKEPADMGLVPLGAGEQAAEGESESVGTFTVPRNYTVKEAVMSGQLWIQNLAVLLAMAGIMGAQHNMVPYATDKGIAAGAAALALGLASGFNAFGRIGMGLISDAIGTKRSLFITILGATIVLFYLLIVNSAWMLILFAVLFGFVYGSTVPLTPRIIAELFGTENMGAIMGVAGIFGAIGPAFGPVVVAAIYDKTGSYSLAFISAGVAMMVALVLFMSLKLPRK